LVELLVVGAIVGLLAAWLLPALTRTRERARVTVCISNLRQIGQAALLYYDDHAALPAENYPGYLLWNGEDYVLYGRLLQRNGRGLARAFFCPSSSEFRPDASETGVQNLGVTGKITAGAYYTRSPLQGGPTRMPTETRALVADWYDGVTGQGNHKGGVDVLYSDGSVRFAPVPKLWRVSDSNAWAQVDSSSVAAVP